MNQEKKKEECEHEWDKIGICPTERSSEYYAAVAIYCKKCGEIKTDKVV